MNGASTANRRLRFLGFARNDIVALEKTFGARNDIAALETIFVAFESTMWLLK